MSCNCSRPRGVCVCSFPRDPVQLARRIPRPSRAFVLAALAWLAVSCSGVQPTPGDGGPTNTPASWVTSVEVAMSILNSTLPEAISIVGALPIPDATKAGIVTGMQAAEASIPGVDQALANYRANPSAANMCVARAAVQLVATTLLSVGDALAAVGLELPSLVLVALGGIGAIIDEILPACPASVDAGVSAQSIAGHLAGRPGMLRPFPRVAR